MYLRITIVTSVCNAEGVYLDLDKKFDSKQETIQTFNIDA